MHYFERYKQHLDSLTKEKNNRCAAVVYMPMGCIAVDSCGMATAA
jgi:hypothetical protein